MTSTPNETIDAPARLWNRNYTLLWQGQFVSQLGSQAFFVAMAFWIKHQTGSATAMGLVMMASQIPAVLLSPIAGVYADRLPRKAIIVGCDLVNGLLTLSLGLLFLLAPTDLALNLTALVVTTTLVGAANAFFRPAVGAAIPDIVPRRNLNAANSLNQGSLQVSTLLGLSLGGVLFRTLGAPLMFLFNGISYLFSAFSEMFMSIPHAGSVAPESAHGAWRRMGRDILSGLSFIWRRAGMRNLMITAAALNFFSMPYLVLMPFFVEDTLGSTPDWYGYIMASLSAGTLLGYAAAGILDLSGPARSAAVVFALIAMTCLFTAIGAAPDAPAALAIMMLAGAANGYVNINLQTLFQLTTPSEMRGRVFSLLTTLAMGLSPIAMGLSGVVADLLARDIRTIYVGTGVMTLLMALAVSSSRAFRVYLAYEDGEAPTGDA